MPLASVDHNCRPEKLFANIARWLVIIEFACSLQEKGGNLMRKALLSSVAALAPLAAISATISTAPANNGSGGIFMDLTALANPLYVTSFATPFSGTTGTEAHVQVWTRAGTYVGFTASSDGWTLLETVTTTRQGTTVNAPIVLANPIALQVSQVRAVYLQCVFPETTGTGIRYTGTAAAPPQTLWENSDIRLFSDTARTGFVPFGGTSFTPRCFSGDVNYEVVPEPATLAVLAAALGGLAIRRRNR